MMKKPTEIEFKYNADGLDFKEFERLALERNPKKVIIASGYDHFYSSHKDKDAFCRHRVGHYVVLQEWDTNKKELNQLTFKRKPAGAANNVTRTEHNIDLDKSVKEEQIRALCEEFGYKYNTSIFKTCFVYTYEYYVFVYYIVHDTNMKEVGRFLEIEALESYDWQTEQDAVAAITAVERLTKSLGITAQARMKKSLWEMFRKDDVK